LRKRAPSLSQGQATLRKEDETLKVVDGASAGAWIRPRLAGDFGAVTREVPKGYEGYVRIFHPASNVYLDDIPWGEVADLFDAVVHPQMQWHSLLGFSDPDELGGFYGPDTSIGAKWEGMDPPTGEMHPRTLNALLTVLAAQTADPRHCYFGLCAIMDGLGDYSADEVKPLLELPMGRNHLVLTGPLSAIDQITRRSNWWRAPNLIWPADRTWYVASEVDFDSTLVGGSSELIEAIVKSPELEAWQVEPTDSLAADADKINGA
jgi:hypothetical protein